MQRNLLALTILLATCTIVTAQQQQQIPKETLRTTGKIIGLFNAGYYVELDSGKSGPSSCQIILSMLKYWGRPNHVGCNEEPLLVLLVSLTPKVKHRHR